MDVQVTKELGTDQQYATAKANPYADRVARAMVMLEEISCTLAIDDALIKDAYERGFRAGQRANQSS